MGMGGLGLGMGKILKSVIEGRMEGNRDYERRIDTGVV